MKERTGMARRPILRVTLGALWMAGLLAGISAATAQNPAGPSLELVDPDVLRVCSDPRNMPFSTDKGKGFENKVAELLTGKLGKSLAYTWYPSSPRLVRNTLAAHRCDLVMGAPQGDDLVQVTNPYYR